MIDDIILQVRPIREEDVRPLVAAAAADGHMVIAPTDVIRRGGEVVGYGSLGGAPMVHVWLDSKRVRARETLMLLQYAEATLARQGARQVVMPCWANSPLAPYMAKLGYMKLGETTLYLKDLKGL